MARRAAQRERQIVYVSRLLEQALALVESGKSDAEAVDSVLDGVDLFELLVVDGKEVTRLFRDGFLHKVNRLDSPSRGWTPEETVEVQGPRSIQVTHVEREEVPVTRITLRFLESRYQVGDRNVRIKVMTAADLEEAGHRLIIQGEGMVRKGTVLAVDTVRALAEHGVATPDELPDDVLSELEAKFSGREE